MILFFDFDGVLHPEDLDAVTFCRAPWLWRILRACPHVDVVFSTSWREIHSIEKMIELVTRKGGEDLAHRFIGATPQVARGRGPFDSRPLDYHREKECRLWLTCNVERHRPWLALDDIAAWFKPNSPNLYLVSRASGLTEDDTTAIIARLNAHTS